MPTVEERLAFLEAKVDTMSDLRNLIVELRSDMNGRFTDVNGRFTELRGDVKGLDQKVDRQFIWLVGTQLALLLAAVGALLGAYYR